MTKSGKHLIQAGIVTACLCNSAFAAYLDLTDSSTISNFSIIANGYEGSINGVDFKLTGTNLGVNFNESYDGSAANTGCQANGGPLACEIDGAGIGNDEITGLSPSTGETITLEFDSAVNISSLDFLDLYRRPNSSIDREQARISIDGSTPYLVDATGSSGDGGYANLDLLSLGGPILGQKIEFTAYLGSATQDDQDNDYAFAGINVSAVPVPAAVWLFGTALLGLFGFNRQRKSA